MLVSSTSSLNQNFEGNRPINSKRSFESATEAGFKTSNPTIFPSLHPLSNFYKERTKVLPSPAFKTPKTANPEPIKKIKMNDQSETVVVKGEEEVKIPQEVEKEERKEKVSNNPPVLEEFRVPKRPARFDMDKKKAVPVPEPVKKLDLDLIHAQFTAVQEPLVVPDNFLADLKYLQNKNIGFVPTKQALKKNLPVKEPAFRAPVRIPEPVKPSLVNQSQGNGLLDLGFGQFDLKSLYNKLEVEYLSLQLIQKAPHLFQICQQNQQKLFKNLKVAPEAQEMLERRDEIMLDLVESPTQNQDLVTMKEDNVKQEIQC